MNKHKTGIYLDQVSLAESPARLPQPVSQGHCGGVLGVESVQGLADGGHIGAGLAGGLPGMGVMDCVSSYLLVLLYILGISSTPFNCLRGPVVMC